MENGKNVKSPEHNIYIPVCHAVSMFGMFAVHSALCTLWLSFDSDRFSSVEQCIPKCELVSMYSGRQLA